MGACNRLVNVIVLNDDKIDDFFQFKEHALAPQKKS
jgi:hypothetical protein